MVKIQSLDPHNLRYSLATRRVPLEAMAGLVPLAKRPRLGQLVVTEVVKLGRNDSLEDRAGLSTRIFVGDRLVGVFGNRYATHQYEGYIPNRTTTKCDLLSVGGVCGRVVSQYVGLRSPTRLRIVGLVGDRNGRPVNTRDFAIEQLADEPTAQVILVLGASMNAGKTTVAGMLSRALTRQGLRVAAAKVTGTAAGKDMRFYASCGARPVLDFIDAGYPSTYLLDPEDLMRATRVLLSQLRATRPDYIVLEVADGIFQRETAMLLGSEEFRAEIGHVFFAANDSLSAESGARHIRNWDLPLRAVSGMLTKSPLAQREAEEATGLPCLSPTQIEDGAAFELLGVPRALHGRAPRAGPRAATRNGTVHREHAVHLVG